MSNSVWLSNNKVQFSFVKVDSRDILVCYSIVGTHRVIFIEDIATGNRIVAPQDQHNQTGKDMDNLVTELAQRLL